MLTAGKTSTGELSYLFIYDSCDNAVHPLGMCGQGKTRESAFVTKESLRLENYPYVGAYVTAKDAVKTS